MTGMTTTTTYLDQLTQSPRLWARVALPQQQMQRHRESLMTRHTPSQHSIVHLAAPERAVQPLAPTPGATSLQRVMLGLPTRSPYLPHQPHQLISNRLRVRRGTRGRLSQWSDQGSHNELHSNSEISWRAYFMRIFSRPTCLSSSYVAICHEKGWTVYWEESDGNGYTG